MASETLEIEVVYACVDEQSSVLLSVPGGTTAAQALERSGLSMRFPEIGSDPTIGIFGKVVPLDMRLAHGDRLEIYRPLVADPKLARRHRAAVKGQSPG